jgi:acyl-CoA thioesterase-2
MSSPVASGGRGFARGEVWTESGLLVATTCQEGLIRMRSASAVQ